MRNGTVAVCGEALIDVIRHADGTQRTVPGGGPFNTARALARLGVPAAFVGRLSTDAYGRELAGSLAADGVSLELASIGPEPTTMAIADVNAEGLVRYEFVIAGTSAPNLGFEMLPERLSAEVVALHVGTLGLAVEPMASTLVQLVGRERGGRLLMIDPNVRLGLVPDAEYRDRLLHVIAHSTIVKASDADVAWLYPGATHEEAAGEMLRAGVRLAAITLGARGAFGAHGSLRLQAEADHVEVTDTVGAGDVFGAALLAWLHEHDAMRPDLSLSLAELTAALTLACRAAAIACSRPGADPPWRSELVQDPT